MSFVGGAEFEFAQGDLRAAFERRRELIPLQKIRRRHFGGVGNLIDAFPQAIRGLLKLFRLIQHDQRVGRERGDGMLARLIQCDREFPARISGTRARLLDQRQDRSLTQAIDGALGLNIETANRFDLVAKKLDAQRTHGFGGENVENTSANGIFADHFHRLAPLVADGLEMRLDAVERQFFTRPQIQRETTIIIARMIALQCRAGGDDGERGRARGEPPQSDGALLGQFIVR